MLVDVGSISTPGLLGNYQHLAGEVGVTNSAYPWTDVRRYGAFGSSPDDAAFLQNAIDSAAAIGAPSTNLVPGATHVIGTVLKYRAGTNLLGSDGSTLQSKAGLGAPIPLLQPFANDQRGCVIRGIVFDHRADLYGNNGNTPCVSV